MKIGIYVAHDDDSIIGVGGTIINRLKLGDEIYIVIFTDGQNSHTESFEIQANPNPQEVKEKRRKEIENAINVLGLKKDCLTFLNQIDAAGDCWKDDKDLFEKVLSITNKEKPDQIYYHYQLDNHVDHRAVSEIFSKVFRELDSPVEAYQFPVWGKIENPDIVCNI